jgi:hypothetical protein
MDPDVITDPVIYRISQYCTENDRKKQELDIKNSACRCGSAHKQQGIAGQEGEDDKARLKEDDKKKDKIGPNPVFLNNRQHVLIEMEKYIDQGIYHGVPEYTRVRYINLRRWDRSGWKIFCSWRKPQSGDHGGQIWQLCGFPALSPE